MLSAGFIHLVQIILRSMTSSLLPERPLLISPTLASTIGLEETVMLYVFAELINNGASVKRPQRENLDWLELTEGELQDAFPFWAPVDIRRVQASLQNLGLLLIDPDTQDSSSYFFAIDEASDNSSARQHNEDQASPAVASLPGTASYIPEHWQPDSNWLGFCKQHGIPTDFTLSLVSEFVAYWREAGATQKSWGNVFFRWTKKKWVKEQARANLREIETTMSSDWAPSPDAIEILANSGVSLGFLEDSIPEFILYWRERGAKQGTWNTNFIKHIRVQWAKFSASIGLDDTPKLIPDSWQPSADCWEIIQLAEIDEEFVRRKIPEFVMFWKDSQQVKPSWNTTFLQFVKMDWARQLKVQELDDAKDQIIAGSTREKIEDRLKQLADRSWAD